MSFDPCRLCGAELTRRNFGGTIGGIFFGRPWREPVCRSCYGEKQREWRWREIKDFIVGWAVLAILLAFGIYLFLEIIGVF